MKNTTIALAIAALAGSAAAQGVSGSVRYNGQDFPGAQAGGANNGGVFNFELRGGLQGYGNDGANNLRTFCIEIGEFVGSGAAQINTNPDGTRSIMGGETNPDQSVTGENADKVEFTTAYLFTQFNLGASGDLAAEDFDSYESQRAMQLAIWHFEEDLGSYDAGTQTYSQSRFSSTNAINDKAADFIAAALDAGWTDVGSVRALNIGGGPEWGRQDMLIMIPLPQGAALAGVGLALVGVRRRRNTLA